jgi:hypothetical protein
MAAVKSIFSTPGGTVNFSFFDTSFGADPDFTQMGSGANFSEIKRQERDGD